MVSAQSALCSELQRTQTLLAVLEDDVNHDALTHLLSRRFFETQVPRLFNHARHDNRSVTSVLLDIDRFGQCSGIYGHLQGNEHPCTVTDTLGMVYRYPDDFIVRVGSEEFAAMLFDLNHDDARQAVACAVVMVTERAEPHTASVAAPYVMLLAGTVTLAPDNERLNVFFEWVDTALHDVKRNRRNMFHFHQGPPGLRNAAGREQTTRSQNYAIALLRNGKCIRGMDTCVEPPRMHNYRQQPNPLLEYTMPISRSVATVANHYLRNAKLPKAISAQQTFQHIFDIHLEDPNAYANMYFARYFEWQDAVRERWLYECIDAKLLISGRVVFMIKLAHQEFVEETFPFQHAECHLNTFRVQPCSFYMMFRLVSGGWLVSLGYQQVVRANTERVTQRLPEHMRVRMKAYGLDTLPELAHVS